MSINRKDSLKELHKITKDKKLAKEIEESIYQWTVEYNETNMIPEFMADNIYQDKANEIIENLNPKFNPTLLTRIKEGKLDSKKIAWAKPEDLFPEKYEEIIKKKAIEKAKKENQASSNLFKCPKCKERKSSVQQKQTRSADEPITTFVTCLECGHVMKF